MSTLQLATAIEPAIRAALAPMSGGFYRVEATDGAALIPSWWLHADNSASLNSVQDAGLVILDIWHESLGGLEEALVKVEFLRDHGVIGAGSYRRQSVTVIHEEQNVHHASILLSAVAFAGAA